MKYFLDTEFIENGKTIELISIGIVTEDGRQLYLCNSDCDLSLANQWVKDNVLPQLPPKNVNFSDQSISPKLKIESLAWQSKSIIASDIVDFCDPDIHGLPEFWGDYCSYDWVVFCQLFGKMIDLPDKYPMHIMDVRQFSKSLDIKPPEQTQGNHNALSDAIHIKNSWEFLNKFLS
jgi:3' exoribonuclease, RNase T-like